MSRRQIDHLGTPDEEKCVAGDEKRIGPIARKLCESRTRGSRTAEQRDERAPFHSIPSSRRASTAGGISRPSAFAVLRLITSSYLVGACTGRSAGFSPFRTRST